ncbi:MAG: ABC transporter substrate-binding protein [Aggregatilineales bacterium]
MLKIGILSTLFGPYQVAGEDGVRGAKLALKEFGYRAGGHDLEVDIEGTNAMGASATQACENLANKGVKLFVGPLSGDEAIAVRLFANEHPASTFVNGGSASQPMFNPAENFFMFNATGAQLMTGLGKYCYETLGFRRIATIGEAYSFPFAQIGGFALDFTNHGGEISNFIWCALGTTDYENNIGEIPDDVDAVYSTLGGTDGLNFLEQFRVKHGNTLPLVAGSIFGDQSLLTSVKHHAEMLKGVVSASTHADNIDTRAWNDFLEMYRNTYPVEERFYAPSFFAFTYYTSMKALLLALDAVDGDITKVQDALKALVFESPVGKVRLDHHRTAIIDTFINEIRQTETGELYTHMLQRIPETNVTFGMSDDDYMEIGDFSVHRMPGMKKQRTLQDVLAAAKKKAKKDRA